MARWTAVLVLFLLGAAVTAHAYVEPPPDGCDQPVTNQTPDGVALDPAQPLTGQKVTFTAGGDPAYIKPGTMVFTVELPSGDRTELRPAAPDGQSVSYTPGVAGPYQVFARWEGKNCASPEQYGAGSAGTPFDVNEPSKPVAGGGGGGPLTTAVRGSAVPGAVAKYGIKAAHRLPGICLRKLASIWSERKLNVSPPGQPNPAGVWVGYYAGSRDISCPQVGAYRASLKLVRSLLIAHMKGYFKFGGHGYVGHMKAGRYSVTTINDISEAYSDFVWRSGGFTYNVVVLTNNGRPKLGAMSIKTVIASFR